MVAFKLWALPLYVLFYNLCLFNRLNKIYYTDFFVLELLNDLLFLFLPILFFSGSKRPQPPQPDARTPLDRTALFLSSLFGISFILTIHFGKTIYFLTHYSFDDLLKYQETLTVALQLLVSAEIFAPLFEEFSRKRLFSQVENRYPKHCLLLMTLNFTGMHLFVILYYPSTIIFYLPISLFLNWHYLHHRSLSFNIFLHLICNLTACCIDYYYFFIPQQLYLTIFLVALVSSVILLPFMIRKRKVA
ncbi:type II CAAX prenyl endopeptidase Rce1 family protein [Vagococcus entomophilus]